MFRGISSRELAQLGNGAFKGVVEVAHRFGAARHSGNVTGTKEQQTEHGRPKKAAHRGHHAHADLL